jgi:hypothetical protein
MKSMKINVNLKGRQIKGIYSMWKNFIEIEGQVCPSPLKYSEIRCRSTKLKVTFHMFYYYYYARYY